MAWTKAAAGALALAAAGHAEARTVLVPMPTATEGTRFLRGVPTLVAETATGAVEVTPLSADHGHLAFGIAVYNKGLAAANFGIENVAATVGVAGVPVLSAADLERGARNRAMWTQIGIAVVTGALAGVAAGASSTTHAHGAVRTPHGAYLWSARSRDPGLGAVAAGATVAGGAAAIGGVRERLAYTLGEIGGDVVQTTTVDPQASYGGRLVLGRPISDRLPFDVRLTIRWNGADYPFSFRATDAAGAAPAATAAPAAPEAIPVPAPALLEAAPAMPAVIPAALVVEPTPARAPEPEAVVVPKRSKAAAPRAPYRNGRDDGVIVPMQ